MDHKTELLVTLTVARHAVNLAIMAKLVNGSPSTISQVFVAWPNFDTTGLPKFVQGSWTNANKLLEKSRIKDHPFFKKKKLVASLQARDVTM